MVLGAFDMQINSSNSQSTQIYLFVQQKSFTLKSFKWLVDNWLSLQNPTDVGFFLKKKERKKKEEAGRFQ